LVLALQQLESAAIPPRQMVLPAMTPMPALKQILAKLEFVPDLTLSCAILQINAILLFAIQRMVYAAVPTDQTVLTALTTTPAPVPIFVKLETVLVEVL